MVLVNKGGRCLVSSAGLRHEPGATYRSFPYATFEEAVLYRLREVTPAELLGPGDDEEAEARGARLATAAGRLGDLEAHIAKIQAHLTGVTADPAVLVPVLLRLEGEKVRA